MKSFLILGIAAASLAAVPALAQPRAGGDGMTRGQVQSRVTAMFARADANRDGFLTQAEAQALRGTARMQRGGQGQPGQNRGNRFARLDTNGDGSISRAEFEAPRANAGQRAQRRAMRGQRQGPRQGMARRGMSGGFGAQAFGRMDANRDGRISLAEATSVRLQRFDRMDANRDGRITREERQSRRAQRPNG